MAEHAVVVNVSRYVAVPGKRDELAAAMKRMAERAAGEAACFGAQTCTSNRDQEPLVAVSRWRSLAALQEFHQTAASIAEREHLSALLSAPAEHENLAPL